MHKDSKQNKKIIIFVIISLFFLIDRILKYLVMENLSIGETVQIAGALNITYLKNTGMAFSLMYGSNSLLIFLNFIVLGLIAAMMIYSRKKGNKNLNYAYGLILAGAVSNLWDRIFYGGVIDYFDLRVWPVFNVADTLITAGAFVVLISIFGEAFSKDVS